ncbi:50S ribosomal protein L9 [bacterium]|nr:50S ribosomal protein L9 [bacterium]
MEVVLKKNIEGIGKFGEVKDVKDGYARNYLIPNGFAVQATVKAKEEIEKSREKFEKEHAELISKLEVKSKEINGQTLSFEVKTTGGKMFGSISNKDVADRINKGHQLAIDKKNVAMETIHEPGEYQALISFGEGIKAEVKITVKSSEKEEKGE